MAGSHVIAAAATIDASPDGKAGAAATMEREGEAEATGSTLSKAEVRAPPPTVDQTGNDGGDGGKAALDSPGASAGSAAPPDQSGEGWWSCFDAAESAGEALAAATESVQESLSPVAASCEESSPKSAAEEEASNGDYRVGKDDGRGENDEKRGVGRSRRRGMGMVRVSSWWWRRSGGAKNGGKRAGFDEDVDEDGSGVNVGGRNGGGNDARSRTYARQKSFPSWLVPGDLLSAVDILNETIKNSSDHGIIDVRKKYPSWTVFQSVYVYAKLQRAWRLQEERAAATAAAAAGGRDSGATDGAPSDELLSDLVHYSSHASAAYGWKLQVVLSGKVHGSNVAALVAKTGVAERDVVSCRWESELHRPAYFLLRDHARRSIVLCIRGTITMKDVVTDLFFEEDSALRDDRDWDVFTARAGTGQRASEDEKMSQRIDVRAHQGIVHSARAIAKETRLLVEAELASHDGYRLVLTGHSMGGGAAAILCSFWRDVFPTEVVAYAYGCPCVAPLGTRLAMEEGVHSVMREGDPFSTLSLGHVADMSEAIAGLCEDEKLRADAMGRLQNRNVRDLALEDMEWCCEIMTRIREQFKAEKFYPSGQLYYIPGKDLKNATISKVHSEKFGEMLMHKDMVELSRHYFSNYEKVLKKLWDGRKSKLPDGMDL